MAIHKLDTIIIEDQFNLADEALLAEAIAAGNERALEHGWTGIQVVKSSQPARKEGDFLCHSFDLLGTLADGRNTDSSTNGSSPSGKPSDDVAAAQSPSL
jgi:hypothetical protein